MGDSSLSDDEIGDLLARLRAGDQAALEALFIFFTEKFRPLARKLLRVDFPRVGLHAETDDVLHDAVLRLIPYLRRSEGDIASNNGRFYALAARVLRNTLLDAARKYFGVLQGQPLGEGVEASHPMLRESSGLNAWRDRVRVHDFIERLPEPEREVLEMNIYLGYGTGRIAKCLGVHPGTVSKRLASAKEILGRMLRADDRKAE